MISLTNRQARQFMLLKQGLLGQYRFTGKQGILDYISQAGCIQYDPVDVCGKNAELTLQSRIKGFTVRMLDELLYNDRLLVDFPDKNLAIIPAGDWPYFERYRTAAKQNVERYPKMEELTLQVYEHIRSNGTVCSDDLELEGDFYWQSAIHWSAGRNPARSALEQMYSTGRLIIHHKKGTRKYYDIAEKHIPAELLNAAEPLPEEREHYKWRVLRRIGAVGLLWNRPSDAWLNIWGLDTIARNEAFLQLLREGRILEVAVEGISSRLYCRAEDQPLIRTVLENPEPKPRCELIAPLDCFLWDRKLIRALFGFHYSWEIYVPPEKRRYGSYTLPVLYGESFIGRVEAAADRKTCTLVVKNIWYEDGVKKTKKLLSSLDGCLKKLARLNGCRTILKITE